MEVQVLFSQDGFFAMGKPAGLISVGPRDHRPEVDDILKACKPGSGLAHRIDMYTSGVLLAATTRKQRAYLKGNWHSITKKVYLAVIESPSWDERTVDTPIDGKTAVTSFTVLERAGLFALVRCELVQNGRTHQIRRHLKSIGCPIIGDRKYHSGWWGKLKVRGGQLLHAWRMEVKLPSGKIAVIQAPTPEDFHWLHFDWSLWDRGACEVLETLSLPTDWSRESKNEENLTAGVA